MPKFITYILKSEVDGTYYFGHSANLKQRLKRHNAGNVRSTKFKRPWEIHYFEELDSKSLAYKRELFFKSIDGCKFLKNNKII